MNGYPLNNSNDISLILITATILRRSKFIIALSKLIPYIIILTLLLNCTNSTEEPEIGQGNKLVKVDEYSLPLPLKNKPNSWIQKFYDKNGHRLLHYFDKYSQEILVYDIRDKELERTITLKETGPNSVGIANSISVRSPDSIYLAINGRSVLTIMNRKGEKVSETEFDWSEASNQVQDFTPLRSRYYADISFDGDVLYAPQRVPFRGYPPPLEIDHKPIVRHDESSGKSELVDFDYPKDYWEDRMPYFLTFNHDADNLYYSLTANHNIYKITKREHEVTELYAKSKFAPEKIENYSNLSGQDDARLYAAMNPRYSALLPDRFRKLFYRIVLLPPPRFRTSATTFYTNHLHSR